MKSLLTEYGVKWTLNRSIYSGKLKMMSKIPITESFFEKEVSVKRINLFDFDVDSIRDFLLNLSNEKKSEIISIADKAIIGKITGFSSIELDYGNPINWHYNPITNTESPKNKKWYNIPDFDSELGDIKVVWEASRFTHFFYLIRAYLLTNNKKYYDSFSNQLEEWIINNPYPYGANFKCGQEASLRMINTLMAYSIFNNLGIATQKDKENVIEIVRLSYKKVLSNFFYAHKCIKNNHTFSEIAGLIVGAWCSEDEKKVREAYNLLDKEVENQFEKDGGFRQYSYNYHRFTLQILECIYKISEKTKIYINEENRIMNSVLLLFQVQNSNGDVPNYGSNDGALIFPLTSCGYRDFRPVLNTMHALIDGKRLYEKGDYDEELLWFSNKKTYSQKYVEKKPLSYKDSGYFTLRHEEGFLMTTLQNFKSRPAHMDQLHIDLWHKGINVFCDTGTYSYASKLGKELTSTSGHNTVKVENKEQMNKRGPFFITDWSKRSHIEHDSNKFVGKMISENNYMHLREISRTEYGYKIKDIINGIDGICKAYFHTPCEVMIVEGGFELFDKNQLIARVRTNEKVEVKIAKRSLFYLVEEEINCVIVKGELSNKVCEMTYQVYL